MNINERNIKNIEKLENAINEINNVETSEQLFKVWSSVCDILGGNETVRNLMDIFNNKHSELYRKFYS